MAVGRTLRRRGSTDDGDGAESLGGGRQVQITYPEAAPTAVRPAAATRRAPP
jgi:hypothetical protein